jgi:hypothetical protein
LQKLENLELTLTLEKTTPNYDSEYRHKCSVRQLCKYRHEMGLKKFRLYLQDKTALHQFFADFQDQYKKGNRGTWNTWV